VQEQPAVSISWHCGRVVTAPLIGALLIYFTEMVRAGDHCVEYISGVLIAEKTGVALLSDVNEYSLDTQVDAVP